MAERAASFIFVLAVCGGLPKLSNANAFLKSNPVVMLPKRMSESDVQTSLLAEIMGVLGSGATKDRLDQMTDSLRPMFTALPKNEYGNLGHATVRYALHRLFVQRHGWFVKGLEPAGGSWNSSSPAGILKDRVPAYLVGMFEERLGTHGLNLHEVAVLASALEHLVHDEAKGRLVAAFEALQLPVGGSVSADTLPRVLDSYMMTYILGGDVEGWGVSMPKDVEGWGVTMAEMSEVYPHWSETQKYVRQVLTEVTHADGGGPARPGEAEVDFDLIIRVVDRIGEGYGQFQAKECQPLKRDLLKLEDRSTGRVRLSDFYEAALGGAWQFSETRDYLRELGALDESDPQDPGVFVANYIGATTNCVASSSFYSVCCMDECEDLMGQLEQSIAASHAEPTRLAELVARFPSPTVPAPRNIPAPLRQRLDEIAASNGGVVPLHGRLFAQWMHHAYPRECAYPHVSGTINPRTPDEWMNETGVDSAATDEEMQQYLERQRPRVTAKDEGEDPAMLWSTDEELLVIRSTFGSSPSGTWWSMGRNMMFVVAFSAMVTSMVRSAKPTGKTLTDDPHKMYV